MSHPRNDWNEALRPTADCIAVERLGDDLTAAEREHVGGCARCSAELALWEEFRDDAPRAGEEDDVRWVGEQIRARAAAAPPSNVVYRNFRPRVLAVAATILIAVGLGVVIERREPAVDVPLTRTDLYRSARVEGAAPTGDVAAAPVELRWRSVPGAERYEVEVLEVDRTPLWRGSTAEVRAVLPPPVVAQFVTGKTIVWQVKAFHGGAVIAESGQQKFRLKPKLRQGV